MEVPSSGTLQSSDLQSGSTNTNTSKQSPLVTVEILEEDFTKDNAASPIDLECQIQAERITKILDEAIYKTKLGICLPNMVQHYTVLSSRLTTQHMDDLIFIFEQYDNPLFSASSLNMAAMDDIKSGDASFKNRLNPELGHLLYIMNSYPTLREHVDEMMEQMESEYAKTKDKNPVPALEYLNTLKRFRDQMVTQMATTAAEELSVKLNIRKMEASNEKLLRSIQEYSETMRTEQENFEKMMSGKRDLIAKLEHELAVLNQAAAIKLKKNILDSDRQMVLMSRSHTIKNQMLKEEEVDVQENYRTLLHQHLMDEKSQRARRFKVETQLLSWLQKYDTEMADKQAEFDDLELQYEEEIQKCEKLEKKLANQDLEYIPLMKERDDEYHAELTAKLADFQLKHAARVIQTAWRQVLANRAETKKLKRQILRQKQERDQQEKMEDAKLVAARD